MQITLTHGISLSVVSTKMNWTENTTSLCNTTNLPNFVLMVNTFRYMAQSSVITRLAV